MTPYTLNDQREKLGEPPWSGPALEAWEEAHGHDVRLKCYAEYGCRVLYDEWERLSDENDRLREERDFLLALSDDQNTLNEQLTDEIGRYREALERIRDEYADSFTWQLHDIADAALDGSA